MGSERHSMNSMKFNEKFLKRNFNEFNDSINRETNKLNTKERDYMIQMAMQRLKIAPMWHDAVARGACYLAGDKFWQLVDCAMKAKKPANYFVGAIGRELSNLHIS